MNGSQSSVNNRRAALPFVPLSLTFDNVRYSVDMKSVKQHDLIYITISFKQLINSILYDNNFVQ
jgi:hypothetical protein